MKKELYWSEYGSNKKYIKVAKRYIYFCKKCGEYITKEFGCSNPICPEEIKDMDSWDKEHGI